MKRLWISFVGKVAISFLIFGWIGTRIYQEKPPIPNTLVTSDGQKVIDVSGISNRQNAWQSLGGMEVG